MNNLRRLILVGALIIGMLELGVSTTFAASPHASYPHNGSHVTWAPDGTGRTDYYSDSNHYQIYDTQPDSRGIAVIFYRPYNNFEFVHFHSCNGAAGDNCPGSLPKEVTGELCMKTGVGNYGAHPLEYHYGPHLCVHAGP